MTMNDLYNTTVLDRLNWLSIEKASDRVFRTTDNILQQNCYNKIHFSFSKVGWEENIFLCLVLIGVGGFQLGRGSPIHLYKF